METTALHYRIGGLKLSPVFLSFDDRIERGEEDTRPYHLFVVEVRGKIASIFVGGERRHSGVVTAFALDEANIRGGGFLYLDPNDRCTLSGFSGDFGSVPEDVARQFAGLLMEDLKNRDIPVADTKTTPDMSRLNAFWQE